MSELGIFLGEKVRTNRSWSIFCPLASGLRIANQLCGHMKFDDCCLSLSVLVIKLRDYNALECIVYQAFLSLKFSMLVRIYARRYPRKSSKQKENLLVLCHLEESTSLLCSICHPVRSYQAHVRAPLVQSWSVLCFIFRRKKVGKNLPCETWIQGEFTQNMLKQAMRANKKGQPIASYQSRETTYPFAHSFNQHLPESSGNLPSSFHGAA